MGFALVSFSVLRALGGGCARRRWRDGVWVVSVAWLCSMGGVFCHL